MNELIEYRVKIVDRLWQAACEFVETCKARDGSTPVADSAWTVHQFAAHVRDVNQLVYGGRVYRTLREEKPMFASFDPDGWMETHYNKDEVFQSILDEFLKSIAHLCETLRGLPNEAWSRESRHETLGEGLTLQLWVERGLAHIEEHIKALK